MELIVGDTLADRIDRQPIPVQQALPLFSQIADALQAAHEKGIVHRDLKPANVKITPSGKIKVLDSAWRRPSTKKLLHTPFSSCDCELLMKQVRESLSELPPYMSPEQARGQRLDHRTDILGIWLYVCIRR
jgi:serine/threonine-protein kinase